MQVFYTNSHAGILLWMVPDRVFWWSMLQDVVTRGGKFLFLYKRPGRRVIVNSAGRMMVCPSSIEASVHQDPAGLVAINLVVVIIIIIVAMFLISSLSLCSTASMRFTSGCLASVLVPFGVSAAASLQQICSDLQVACITCAHANLPRLSQWSVHATHQQHSP